MIRTRAGCTKGEMAIPAGKGDWRGLLKETLAMSQFFLDEFWTPAEMCDRILVHSARYVFGTSQWKEGPWETGNM